VDHQRARRDVVENPRHHRLDRRDVHPERFPVIALIGQPSGLQDQQAELAKLDPAIGDLLLHHLLCGERLALGDP